MVDVITFENISKRYRLGTIGTGSLSRDLERWWITKVLKRDDPFSIIGSEQDPKSRYLEEYFWALRDINFGIKAGEALGIIGKNGAGKSTLLKVLSRITAPSEGKVTVRGRVASLLEVGTGFHPEMTGRENIFMNGLIMGMTKAEIRGKLEEIVDFAEVGRYLDTPIKRYSSGMVVRLGFAIAAHLEPEILVVDEVLAVGDAEFQKKAIGKMQDVSKNSGRTVLFVSHNMTSVNRLCSRNIVLDGGKITFDGDVKSGIDFYLNNNNLLPDKIINSINYSNSDLSINSITVNGAEENFVKINSGQEILSIEVDGVLKATKKMSLHLLLFDKNRSVVASYHPSLLYGDLKTYPEGKFTIREKISLPDNLIKGEYSAQLSLAYPLVEHYLMLENAFKIEFEGVRTEISCELDYESAGVVLFRDANR